VSQVLPYISLGTTDGVEREYVGHFDDGVSHAIHIPDGLPFGNFVHSSVYVSLSLAVICLHKIKHVCDKRSIQCANELLPHFFTSTFALARSPTHN
jgi:hypothetical protein